MNIAEASFEPRNARAVVKPFLLSHGTLEVANIRESRRFYEEFLGLECVRHGRISMLIRCGMKWHIVAVEVRKNIHPVHLLNHWGIEVRRREEVDQAWRDAQRLKDEYGIRRVRKPSDARGIYAFYLQDLDGNWWEISHCASFRHDEYFAAGDRFGREEEGDEAAVAEAVAERDEADRETAAP